MKRACPICDREDRAEIENAILAMTSSDRHYDIDKIAEEFEVDVSALKMHAMFHTPLVDEADLVKEVEAVTGSTEIDDEKEPVVRDSLARQMKLREVDILTDTTNEYLVTLHAAGRRINRLFGVINGKAGEDDDQAIRLSKYLTKPMVDLYIGLGSEIRASVKTMAEINKLINGAQDETTTGLMALANAIRGSDSE